MKKQSNYSTIAIMANRSYLYSVDKIPAKEKRKLSIKGLSEWKYAIPPVYLVLVSGSTRLSNSIIWDLPEKTAIVGDYNEGLDNLKALIKLIKKNNVQHPEMFERAASEAIAFLESSKVRQKYILLEPGEIFEMNEEMSEEVANELLKDSKVLMNNIKTSNLDAISKSVGDDIKTHWEDLLGIDYFDDILYYHFE